MDLHLPTPAGELTRAEQKILDYINTNTDTFLFSSIGQLAQRLEISDATVSRFARHVGCRDFKALKSLVAGAVSRPGGKADGHAQSGGSLLPPGLAGATESVFGNYRASAFLRGVWTGGRGSLFCPAGVSSRKKRLRFHGASAPFPPAAAGLTGSSPSLRRF